MQGFLYVDPEPPNFPGNQARRHWKYRYDRNAGAGRLRLWWTKPGAPSYRRWLNRLVESVRRTAEETIS